MRLPPSEGVLGGRRILLVEGVQKPEPPVRQGEPRYTERIRDELHVIGRTGAPAWYSLRHAVITVAAPVPLQ